MPQADRFAQKEINDLVDVVRELRDVGTQGHDMCAGEARGVRGVLGAQAKEVGRFTRSGHHQGTARKKLLVLRERLA